jgi:hypothetical protein
VAFCLCAACVICGAVVHGGAAQWLAALARSGTVACAARSDAYSV